MRFAAERTLLAWIRTGLAMMGFGFVVARFGLFLREIAPDRHPASASTPGLSLAIGTMLVALGVGSTLTAAARYASVIRRIDRGLPFEPPRLASGLVVASALALIGLALVVHLFRLHA